MTADDLNARSKAISKQELIKTVLMMKSQINETKSTHVNLLSDMLDEKLDNKFNSLTQILNTIAEDQAVLKSRCDKLENEIECLKTNQHPVMSDVAFEIEERIIRRNNVIVRGMKEETSGSLTERAEQDKLKVLRALKVLDVKPECVKSIQRIGRPHSERPRLIRIICIGNEDKWNIIKKSKSLRDSQEFSQVFMNPDLTASQQKMEKELRDELKRRKEDGEDVIIHRGKVILRNEKTHF